MRHPRRRSRPQTESLEDRWLPSVMSLTAPTGNGPDALVLRLSTDGTRLQLFDNGPLAVEQALNGADPLTGVSITGAAGEIDTLTLDYSLGFFSVPVSFIGGSGGPDRVVVSADVNFTLSAASLTSSQGSAVTLSGVEEAELTGGGGNNTINASGFSGSTTLSGGGGDDTLSGGSGIDSILGGAGADTINSLTGGNDRINGGVGNDTYVLVPGSTITVIDDGGDETVNLNSISRGGVTATVGATSTTDFETGNPTSGVSITATVATLIGTNLADTFTAANTTAATLVQTLVGGAGNDTFTDQSTANLLHFVGGALAGLAMTGGGNDTYVLDPGSTITVVEDGGDDTIDLSTSRSTSGATVTLRDADGSVTVAGGSASITGTIKNIIGTAFNDSITGNSEDNLLLGGGGNDQIDGGGGNDTIEGGGGDDSLVGGDGRDTALGGDGRDTLGGGLGNDSLDGGAGSDSLLGGGGNDFYTIVPGSTETIVGSAGVDTISFATAQLGISLSLTSSGAQKVDSAGNRVVLVGVIENVIGTPFDDHINGNNADNVIVGGGGDDHLNGHSGRDVLIGGSGEDRLVGGPDDDILIGGTTRFDADAAALLAVQAEWSSPRDYATRVANLRGTGTGTGFDNRLNGNFFLKSSGTGQTVFDDGVGDKLTGSSGLDWFFVFALDKANDRHDESVN
jgi:Ca2+-binding RTX toxin-like protein